MKNSTNQSLLAVTDPSIIRAELERLLSDRRFSGARQMSAFLRYVVSETLDGNGNRIKAYTVGVDALGKADDFDAQSDPSVRVLALRLRKSLEAAYADEPECHARIVMTVGSYVPEFYKPYAFVSNGDSEELHETRGAAATTSARVMSGDSAGTSLRNDLPDESHPAGRHLAACDKTASQSRLAGISHHHRRRSGSGETSAGRTARMPDFMSAMLSERVGLIMAVALLAAAWQVSVNTASAATVSIEAVAPGTEAVPFSQVDPRAGNPLVNVLKKTVVVLPNR